MNQRLTQKTILAQDILYRLEPVMFLMSLEQIAKRFTGVSLMSMLLWWECWQILRDANMTSCQRDLGKLFREKTLISLYSRYCTMISTCCIKRISWRCTSIKLIDCLNFWEELTKWDVKTALHLSKTIGIIKSIVSSWILELDLILVFCHLMAEHFFACLGVTPSSKSFTISGVDYLTILLKPILMKNLRAGV